MSAMSEQQSQRKLGGHLTHFFKGSLCEEVTLDAGQCLMGVVIGLFNQT